MSIDNPSHKQRQRRWRLLLGEDGEQLGQLEGQDSRMDSVLGALYEPGFDREKLGAGYGKSMPKAAKWMGEIKQLFPSSAVEIIQKDAVDRLDMASLLQDPDFLKEVKPDVHLVAQLMTLKNYIPDQAKDNARKLVQKLVDELLKKYQPPMEQAVRGALNRAIRNMRPRAGEINWNATIRKNLKTYQPEYNAIIPEKMVGYGRKQRRTRKLILCVDQSGSMANSVIYSSIFAAVLSSMPALSTNLVVFDTAIVDMTEQLQDPVDVLFGIQLGGGTDIAKAMQYCESLVESPTETHLVLISDLCEGGDKNQLLQTTKRLIDSGVNVVTLLALADDGAPWFDKNMAANFTALGSPAFACTPDLFSDLMSVALERKDLHHFASTHNLPVISGEQD